MSRVEKYKNRNKNKEAKGRSNKETLAGDSPQGRGQKLPPRDQKHRSSKQQMTQLFYHVLIILFIGIVVLLFMYGQKAMDGPGS